MRVIATYDVATDTKEGRRRLARIARMMRGDGVRVQKSVFECDIDLTQFEKLRLAAEALLVPAEDSVLLYRLGECCAGNTLRLGRSGKDPHELDGFIL